MATSAGSPSTSATPLTTSLSSGGGAESAGGSAQPTPAGRAVRAAAPAAPRRGADIGAELDAAASSAGGESSTARPPPSSTSGDERFTIGSAAPSAATPAEPEADDSSNDTVAMDDQDAVLEQIAAKEDIQAGTG